MASAAQSGDRDCADFANQAQAQDFYLDQGGPASDPHRLDGSDEDGVACESLPCPCNRSTTRGGQSPAPAFPHEPKRGKVIRARVVRVIDGDTIKVRYRGRRRTVRIIGIDTPETKRPGVGVECGGPQASEHLADLAPRRAKVVLRTDPTQDTIDRYGRLLAYVGRKGRDVGRAQIASGWAKTYVYGGTPFRRTAAYRRSEAKAKRLAKGVHGMCGGDFHSDQPNASSRPRALATRCGSVSYGGRGYVLYYARMGCAKARRRVRHVHRYKRLRGWRCSSGTRFRTGGHCKRGGRYFGWHPGD